jgi:hypothetical protein
MTLRWEPMGDDGSEFAHSGDVSIGLVTQVKLGDEAGKWAWKIDGVHMKWIATGHGWVATKDEAKDALSRAWLAWMGAARLEPFPDFRPSS